MGTHGGTLWRPKDHDEWPKSGENRTVTCNFKHDLCPIGKLLSKQPHKTIRLLTTFINVIFIIILMTDHVICFQFFNSAWNTQHLQTPPKKVLGSQPQPILCWMENPAWIESKSIIKCRKCYNLSDNKNGTQ